MSGTKNSTRHKATRRTVRIRSFCNWVLVETWAATYGPNGRRAASYWLSHGKSLTRRRVLIRNGGKS